MEHANKKFAESEMMLLSHVKGTRLVSIDAVLAAPPDNSWNTVRLHFEGFDIDINNFLANIVIDEFGTLEEFGILSVTEADGNTLSIPEVGTDTTVFEVGQIVNRVFIVNDVADVYGNGLHVARIEYPQAIAFDTNSGIIMFDKEVWFSEMIAIKNGATVEELLYDDSVNWVDDPEEDPSTHFEFSVEIQEL